LEARRHWRGRRELKVAKLKVEMFGRKKQIPRSAPFVPQGKRDDKFFGGGSGGWLVVRGGEKKEQQRFLSPQADTFAGANVKRKSVGLLRSK
jgi:hypothetical protein